MKTKSFLYKYNKKGKLVEYNKKEMEPGFYILAPEKEVKLKAPTK
jgi:hypothetical protein